MKRWISTQRAALIGALLVAGILGLGVLPSAADHGTGVSGLGLARATFTDDVDVQFRVKLDGRRTTVVNVSDPSDVVTSRIQLADGARIPWHTHPGPVVVSVHSGHLTYVNASDCVRRSYPAGTAFVDPGQGNVHTAYATGHTVLIATFFDVDSGPTQPQPAPEGCDPYP